MDEQGTEVKIKKAARKVFTQKGMYGARMQEIADKAGINKALLHYYYRNKDQLFVAVFQDIVKEIFPKLFPVFNAPLPLEVKVYKLADIYIDFLKKNPDLPLFVLFELQQNPDRLVNTMKLNMMDHIVSIQQQLEDEIKKGNIAPIRLSQFIMNLLSMMVFPFVARPLISKILEVDPEAYDALMEERKTEIPRFIMNALKP
jgi:AcrR family transcriptional regulator